MYFLSFYRTTSKFETEHIQNPKPDLNSVKPGEKTRCVPKKNDNRLQRQLSATLATQTERDHRLAQLTEELAVKSALLESEANAAEATKHAGLEPRELVDRLLVQTSPVEHKEDASEAGRFAAVSRPARAHARVQRARAADADEYETELGKVC